MYGLSMVEHGDYTVYGLCRWLSGWWFVWNIWILFSHSLGMSSSHLTNSYFSEGFKPPSSGYSWLFLWDYAVYVKFHHDLTTTETHR